MPAAQSPMTHGKAEPDLTVLVERRSSYAIVRLMGALDYLSHPGLVDRLHLLLDEMRPPRICIDLNSLTSCDSSGLACLVMAWKAAGERGGTLMLLRPAGEAARVLSLFGLAALIPVVDELPE